LKLLFDANLSPKLPKRLQELFPGSIHVFETDLAKNTTDEQIWAYAAINEFAIVTADKDFLEIAARRGAPQKIIRLERCDYRTSKIEDALRRNAIRITELLNSPQAKLILRNTP